MCHTQQISHTAFKIQSSSTVLVHLTSTGERVYGGPRRDRMICELNYKFHTLSVTFMVMCCVHTIILFLVNTAPFENALRMIRHTRWWEDHTQKMIWLVFVQCVELSKFGKGSPKNMWCRPRALYAIGGRHPALSCPVLV